MNDPYNLSRFIEAQEVAYCGAVDELKRGRKTGHWIWYIFPQIVGLGHSHMSRRYSISSLEEAKAYVEHPVLGTRLVECVELAMATEAKSADKIFGDLDAMKFRSCLTLFATAGSNKEVFQRALERYFDAQLDPQTIQAMKGG